MSTNSPIEWTDHTFNPWWGCVKVSAGCTHCYADTLATRYGHDIWGPRARRRFFGDKHWQEPIKWNKQAEQDGQRRRVFCASMADVCELLPADHPDLDAMAAARLRLWETIEATPMLDWLLLTKRPENIIPLFGVDEPVQNIWWGTSVENQAAADTRIPHLLRVPAHVRFLSCEPLLGPVDICNVSSWDDPAYWWGKTILGSDAIGWIIAGGESGHGARPMHPDWARSLRDQCRAAGVAFHFKQWGEYRPAEPAESGILVRGREECGYYCDSAVGHVDHSEVAMVRVGKKAAGRILDGRTWDEFPEVVHA